MIENNWKDIGSHSDDHGNVYWVYETPDGDYICVKNAQWETDYDDDLERNYHFGSWAEVTIIEAAGERVWTKEETSHLWYDLQDIIEEALENVDRVF
jgi:hypothetical protein